MTKPAITSVLRVEDKTAAGINSANAKMMGYGRKGAQAVSEIEKPMSRIGGLARGVATTLGGLATGVVAGGLASIGVSFRRIAETQKEVVRQAERYNAEIGRVAGQARQMRLLGHETQDLSDIYETLIERVGELEKGEAMAVEHFKNMGLAAKDFIGLDVAGQTALVVTALSEMESTTKRATEAYALFGGDARPLLDAAKDADAFETAMGEVNPGIEEASEKIREMQDEWDEAVTSLIATDPVVTAIENITSAVGGLAIAIQGVDGSKLHNIIDQPLVGTSNDPAWWNLPGWAGRAGTLGYLRVRRANALNASMQNRRLGVAGGYLPGSEGVFGSEGFAPLPQNWPDYSTIGMESDYGTLPNRHIDVYGLPGGARGLPGRVGSPYLPTSTDQLPRGPGGGWAGGVGGAVAAGVDPVTGKARTWKDEWDEYNKKLEEQGKALNSAGKEIDIFTGSMVKMGGDIEKVSHDQVGNLIGRLADMGGEIGKYATGIDKQITAMNDLAEVEQARMILTTAAAQAMAAGNIQMANSLSAMSDMLENAKSLNAAKSAPLDVEKMNRSSGHLEYIERGDGSVIVRGHGTADAYERSKNPFYRVDDDPYGGVKATGWRRVVKPLDDRMDYEQGKLRISSVTERGASGLLD